jgi:hypothetical protein
MKVKQLIETLLKDLDPKAEIKVIIRQDADEAARDKAELIDVGYKDGTFVITIVEWL